MLSTISEMDPVLIAAAVIPAVILLLQVYRADRLEKEPTGLLISLLLFGVIATALAIVTETIGENILLLLFDETDLGYLILSNFIVVALSEEGFKLLLLRWRTWRSPNFNCQFDGVVYAVFVSLGLSDKEKSTPRLVHRAAAWYTIWAIIFILRQPAAGERKEKWIITRKPWTRS